MKDDTTATVEAKDKKNETVHVTVRTPAGIPAPFDFKTHERVDKTVRTSVAYAALVDSEAITRWRAPEDMECLVHDFDGREGGEFRISLTYADPDRLGKSSGRTDTYCGRFLRLVPDELVVETMQFETDDDVLRGSMTLTTTLNEVDGGTEVVMFHEGIPDVVPAADNELGTQMALAKLRSWSNNPRPHDWCSVLAYGA